MRRLLVLLTTAAVLATTVGLGLASSFSLSTAQFGAAAVSTPVMFPVSVTITNRGGGTAGKPENNDTVTLVYSRLINAPTICSGWSNTGTNASVKLQWSILNGGAGANDRLVADGTGGGCATGLFIGSIDLGAAGYATGTKDVLYPNTTTTIAFGTSTTTITATLAGQKGGTPGTVSGGGAATWTPDSTVTDRNGNSCGANLSMTSATTQF